MLFSGIPFLYYFLPVVLLVYFAVPRSWKNGVLLLFSLIFYGWGEPRYILLMAVSILSAYLFGLAIEHRRGSRAAKYLTVISVCVSLSFLLIFKYADFIAENLNLLPFVNLPLPGLSLPIGISFYTFQIISYTVDVYRGRASAQRSLISFGAYVSLFPQLIAGPIVRYTDIDRELKERSHSWEQAARGVRRFVLGLSKKVLIANVLGELADICRGASAPSVLFCWLYAAALVLQLYFDFSGYSDMAIGLGSIFGFHFPENFRYPLISTSVKEFWRRWHISLGSWFRDYVYIPLGGSRTTTLRFIRNIGIVWLLTGIWHGAAWNFVLWGVFFGLLLLLERFLWGQYLEKLPAVLSHLYLLLILCFSFVLFSADSLAQAGQQMCGMLGLAGLPAATSQTWYYLKSYAVLLAGSAVGATPIPAVLTARAKKTRIGGAVLPWAEPVLLAALLLLVTAFLVDGSYNPFLYFRF